MSLFARKKRQGARLTRKAPARVAKDRQRTMRQWRRRFRRLLRLPQENRRTIPGKAAVTHHGWLREAIGQVVKNSLLVLLVGVGAISLPIAGYAGYRALLMSPHFVLRHVELHGAERVTGEDVRHLLNLNHAVSTLTLNEAEVAQAVRRHEWASTVRTHSWRRTVEARVVLPHRLNITVRERQPVALLSLGELYLVDNYGEVFLKATPETAAGLPVLTGFERADMTDPGRQHETKRRIRTTLSFLRVFDDAGLTALVPLSELESHLVYGVIARTADEGAEFWLGEGRFREKVGRLADVLADLAARGQRPRRVYLDGPEALRRVIVEATDAPANGRPALAANTSMGVLGW